MIVVPALIVAVISGLFGAALTLILGFGWWPALLAYWISGSLGLMAVLTPRIYREARVGGVGAPGRSGRLFALRPVGWMLFGLLLIFWAEFHTSLPYEPIGRDAVEAAAPLLQPPAGDGLPPLSGEWAVRLAVLLGIGAYIRGVSCLVGSAADLCALPQKG